MRILPGMARHEETAHCPRCRTRRDIIDTDTAHTNKNYGAVAMPIAVLDCGHTVSQGPEYVTGPAPGGEAASEAARDETTRRRLAAVADEQDRYGY